MDGAAVTTRVDAVDPQQRNLPWNTNPCSNLEDLGTMSATLDAVETVDLTGDDVLVADTAIASGSSSARPTSNYMITSAALQNVPSAAPASPAPPNPQQHVHRNSKRPARNSHDELTLLKQQLESEREQWDRDRRDYEADAERHARFTRQKVFALEDRAEHSRMLMEAALGHRELEVAALRGRIARLEGERDEARVRCKVCFSEEPQEVRRLPCGHVACALCIGRLPTRLCPFCRKGFDSPSRDTLVVYL